MEEKKCSDCKHEYKKEDGWRTCGCQTHPPHKDMAGEGGKK